MRHFSVKSRRRLNQCHLDLQLLFHEVLQKSDCSILCGQRDMLEQNRLFAEGKSKLKWPESKHNKDPAEAVDVIPYPLKSWDDLEQFKDFSKVVWETYRELKDAGKISHELRHGADWDRDGETSDEKFQDWPHWELVKVH